MGLRTGVYWEEREETWITGSSVWIAVTARSGWLGADGAGGFVDRASLVGMGRGVGLSAMVMVFGVRWWDWVRGS